KTVVGEREKESDEVVNLGFAQSKALHAAVKKRVWNAALVVMVHHIPKGCKRTIVHIGGGNANIAERLALEGPDVGGVFGHQEPAELGIIRLQGKLIDLLHVTRFDDPEGLAGKLGKVFHMCRDADIVELLIREERRDRVECVAGTAASLALEQGP